jgi:hypothetical protein
MLPEPPRTRPWNHHSLRPFNAGTGSVSKFQLRRADLLAINAVPGTLVVSPSLAPAGLNQGNANIRHGPRQAAGNDAARRARSDDHIIPAPRRC